MKNKPLASWSLHALTATTIYITDDDTGRSVTNDPVNVVRDVVAEFGDRRIIYRDTMGRWDVLVHVNGSFVGFAPCSKEEIPQ